MKRDIAVFVLLALAGGACAFLAYDCRRQHARCDRLEARLAELAAVQSRTAARLDKVGEGLGTLEKWIETSSVEGRLKNYQKQIDAECTSLKAKMQELRSAVKDAAEKGLEAARRELAK